MADDRIPEPHHLPNKPLVEAIFELRWGLLTTGPASPPQDPGFRIALGKFYDEVRKHYPVVVDLPTSQIPEDMTAYAVRHQFRTGKNEWPLTQLGPGILTVNDTTGYTWDSFRPKVLQAIEAIFDAYPADLHEFRPQSVRLHYIDAIEFDPDATDPISFLEEHLHTKVVVEPLLFDDPDNPDAAQQVRLNLNFPLSKPKGIGALVFANGARENRPSIIMEILIRSDASDVPQSPAAFATWIDDAHAIVDKWFFTLCRGDLLRRFEEKPAHA
jgi:uncharacterized protein (TIGR04255 family)